MQTHFSPSPQADINQNPETVIFLLQDIQRPGIDSLIDYLLNSDYFTAPASTRYHNNFPGGLCLHSLKVMRMFSEENKLWVKYGRFKKEVIQFFFFMHSKTAPSNYSIIP